jgi:hypothetical protein
MEPGIVQGHGYDIRKGFDKFQLLDIECPNGRAILEVDRPNRLIASVQGNA